MVDQEESPAAVAANPNPLLVFQVRTADGDFRGLLWALDVEMVTPASSESAALERVCQHYGNTGKKQK